MPLKKEYLPVKDEFGDNGWFKIGPAAMSHFYHQQRTLCGVSVTSQNRNHLISSEDNLAHCTNCIKARRNQLISRMLDHGDRLMQDDDVIFQPVSHSPNKPQ